jgi:hypothetical protein
LNKRQEKIDKKISEYEAEVFNIKSDSNQIIGLVSFIILLSLEKLYK